MALVLECKTYVTSVISTLHDRGYSELTETRPSKRETLSSPGTRRLLHEKGRVAFLDLLSI